MFVIVKHKTKKEQNGKKGNTQSLPRQRNTQFSAAAGNLIVLGGVTARDKRVSAPRVAETATWLLSVAGRSELGLEGGGSSPVFAVPSPKPGLEPVAARDWRPFFHQ